MKYLWKLVGICGIMFGLGATPGLAQSITCFGSVQTGATMSGASISGAGFEFDGLNARSRTPDFGVGAGCDMKVSGPWKVGVFGDYTWRDVSTQISVTPVTISLLGLGNTYTLGARGGYELKGGTLVYALVGYTNSEISFGGLANMPSSMKGITLGGGVEIPLMANLSFAPEIRFTRYEKLNVIPNTADIQYDTMSAVARLKLTF